MKTKTDLLKQVFLLALLFVLCAGSANLNNPESIHRAPKNQRGTASFPFDSKIFKFEQMNAGNCVMQGGNTVEIFPDGRAVFTSTVWTTHTHSGDTWHHHIYFYNTVGVVIFQVSFDGPNHMNDDGTHYPFVREFNFPANIYLAINTVSMGAEC
jgi:hypothetical protein